LAAYRPSAIDDESTAPSEEEVREPIKYEKGEFENLVNS